MHLVCVSSAGDLNNADGFTWFVLRFGLCIVSVDHVVMDFFFGPNVDNDLFSGSPSVLRLVLIFARIDTLWDAGEGDDLLVTYR